MKLRTKSIITLVAMLLSGIGAFAADGTGGQKWTLTYLLDREASTEANAGTVVGTISGSTATLTVTPAEGNYITKDQITVVRTIAGEYAHTRSAEISSPVEITATSQTADPSGKTTYTFDASDPNFNYEVTANFQSRIDVAGAQILIPKDAVFEYNSEAIKPDISVTYADEALTADQDYTVAYANNVNAGTAEITITGIGKYKNTNTTNFVIQQANVSFWFETSDGQEAKKLTTTYGATFTKPVLKMSETGAADVIGVEYTVDNAQVATIDATTGELDILKAGTVVVTAAAADTYTNKEGSNYKADPANTKASYSLTINTATPTLQFSKETAEATMGAEFEAPTLTVTPEGLEGVKYTSSNTDVARVNETTGAVTLVAAGKTTIKASFAGNDNYKAAEASYTLTVSEATPQTVTVTLTFSEKTVSATLGEEFEAPTLTIEPEGLQGVKYTSSNTDVANVNETTGAVTLVAAGKTTIKASFAGNDNYKAAEASYTLTVSEATPQTETVTLTFSEKTVSATLGEEFEAPTLTIEPEGLQGVKYTSSNTDVANVNETTGAVTLVAAGKTTIKASFAGNDNYKAAEASYTLTVSEATPQTETVTLTFSEKTVSATLGEEFEAPTLTIEPEGLQGVKYTSSNTDVANVNETTGAVTLVAAGKTTIKASFAGNDNYKAAEASYTLTVSEATPQTETVTLTFSEKTVSATLGEEFEAPTLTIEPEGLQGVKYTSSNTDVARVNETTGAVTLVAAGKTTIKASFAGNDNYKAAEASYTLTVSEATPQTETVTLTFSEKTVSATLGEEFEAPTLTIEPEGLQGVKYTSSNTDVANVNETTGAVTLVAAGKTTIKASFAGNDNYKAAEASYTLTVSEATPQTETVTLTFSEKTVSATLGEEFEAPTLTIEPEGLQGVKYTSSNTDVANVNETTGAVTLVAAGKTTIKASFAGNDNYKAAEASYTLTVSEATPQTETVTLTFSEKTVSATLGEEFEAPTLTIEPEGLLGVKYTSSNTNVATVNENTGAVTLVGAGETVIKASFAGTTVYEAAEASYKLTVSEATPQTETVTLTFSEKTVSATLGEEFEAPTLTIEPEGLQGVKYTSSNTDVATVNETTGAVTLVAAGETTIKASFAGNDNYEAAEASYTLTVSEATPQTVTVTLTFSEKTVSATLGEEFEAPTLTIEPEGLQGVKYTSSNTDVATVNETTGAVTLVAAGETTIKASFAGNDNYEAAEASYTLTVSEATPQTVTVTLTFSEKTVSATLGEEFEAPTLTIEPEGLQGVKYTSSNTDVATVNETTGAVTLVAAGETTITAKFAGNDNYEAAEASYTLTVNRAQSEGYGLWINDIQVTEDNYFDVLGNKTDSKSGTIVFNPETNTLVMTNDVSNVEIESRLESLTLHINDVNKVKSIRFNNFGDATKTGKLAITTNGNFPGQIIITNDAGVSAISGFSEITLNMGLQYLEPELVEIENGELYKYDWDNTNSDNPVKKPDTKAVCDAVTIGVVITPLTRNVTVSMANASDYTAKDENGNTVLDENGNPKTVSMMNFAQNKDILLTLWTKNDEDNYQKGNDGDWPDAGFDNSDGDPGITMVITMTDAQALAVAASVLANTIQPGGTTYSMEFKGATFIVPAGSGEIDVWVKTDPGYVYKLLPVGLSEETHKLDFNSPSIKEYEDLGNGKIKVTVEYNDLPTQTYYMLYLAEEAPSGARGGTRLGKRDKAHGKLYSVGVRPRSITDVNPPSEASGGVIDEEEDPEGVIDNPTPPTPPTGIQTVASESSANSNKWFTADGRQLEGKPTKPGFYIRNGKKVVLK